VDGGDLERLIAFQNLCLHIEFIIPGILGIHSLSNPHLSELHFAEEVNGQGHM